MIPWNMAQCPSASHYPSSFFSCWSIWKQWRDDDLIPYVYLTGSLEHIRLTLAQHFNFPPWTWCQKKNGRWNLVYGVQKQPSDSIWGGISGDTIPLVSYNDQNTSSFPSPKATDWLSVACHGPRCILTHTQRFYSMRRVFSRLLGTRALGDPQTYCMRG